MSNNIKDVEVGKIVTVCEEAGHDLFYYNLRVTSIDEDFINEFGEHVFVAYGEPVSKEDEEYVEEFSSRIEHSNFVSVVE